MNTTVEKERMTAKTMPRKKRTGLYIFLVFIVFVVIRIALYYYIRWGVHGQVVDKETRKPIAYALVKFRTAYGNDRATTKDITTVVADAKGYYSFPTRLSDAESFTWSKPGFEPRTGQELQVWFPGYKKYVAFTEGKKVFEGKMDIVLERPKTAEEAVGDLESGRELRPAPTAVKEKIREKYHAEILKEVNRIISTYPKNEFSDKAFFIGILEFGGNKEKVANWERENSFCAKLVLKDPFARKWCDAL